MIVFYYTPMRCSICGLFLFYDSVHPEAVSHPISKCDNSGKVCQLPTLVLEEAKK